MIKRSRIKARLTRKKRVRKKVRGTPERPRLSVYRSAKHIYAQIIDDERARTLADASSLSKEIREKVQDKGGNKEGAKIVGEFIAKRALEKGIKKVVFDRNGFLYHGRVKVLAEGAREHGLEF
ncbi:MAG: 50S ribosomal protein L18 [Deltaproteobacteria bacterium]|nr:50S ribosomal protein L18 [Deltaproteobacteria bacterium]